METPSRLDRRSVLRATTAAAMATAAAALPSSVAAEPEPVIALLKQWREALAACRAADIAEADLDAAFNRKMGDFRPSIVYGRHYSGLDGEVRDRRCYSPKDIEKAVFLDLLTDLPADHAAPEAARLRDALLTRLREAE